MDNYEYLIDLQEIDLELDKQEGLIEQVLKELVDSSVVDQLTTKSFAVKKELERLALGQSGLQLEISESKDKVASLNERMFGGKLRNEKELKSLQDEITHFEKLHTEKEERLLDLMVRTESCDSLLLLLDGKLEKATAQAQDRQIALETKKRDLEAMISYQRLQRAKITQEIPATLMDSYTQIRNKKGGIAVSQLFRDMCGICRIVIPSSELQQMKRSKEWKKCSGCGRIILAG